MANESDPREAAKPQPPTERVIQADALFGTQKEITIEFEGMKYRLRITRKNRLILQK